MVLVLMVPSCSQRNISQRTFTKEAANGERERYKVEVIGGGERFAGTQTMASVSQEKRSSWGAPGGSTALRGRGQ